MHCAGRLACERLCYCESGDMNKKQTLKILILFAVFGASFAPASTLAGAEGAFVQIETGANILATKAISNAAAGVSGFSLTSEVTSEAVKALIAQGAGSQVANLMCATYTYAEGYR